VRPCLGILEKILENAIKKDNIHRKMRRSAPGYLKQRRTDQDLAVTHKIITEERFQKAQVVT
jgi:hypothetical protein